MADDFESPLLPSKKKPQAAFQGWLICHPLVLMLLAIFGMGFIVVFSISNVVHIATHRLVSPIRMVVELSLSVAAVLLYLSAKQLRAALPKSRGASLGALFVVVSMPILGIHRYGPQNSGGPAWLRLPTAVVLCIGMVVFFVKLVIPRYLSLRAAQARGKSTSISTSQI